LVQAVDTPKKDVTAQLALYLVTTNKDGKEELVASDKAKPGDVVEYQVVYKNVSKGGVKGLDGTLPVPRGMEYLPKTAVPVVVKASLDETKFEPVPLKRKVKLPDGKMKEEEVPYIEYRSLRWSLGDLAAGASVSAKARMRLLTTVAASPVSHEKVEVKEEKVGKNIEKNVEKE